MVPGTNIASITPGHLPVGLGQHARNLRDPRGHRMIGGDDHNLLAFRADLVDRVGEIRGRCRCRFRDDEALDHWAARKILSEINDLNRLAHANHLASNLPMLRTVGCTDNAGYLCLTFPYP